MINRLYSVSESEVVIISCLLNVSYTCSSQRAVPEKWSDRHSPLLAIPVPEELQFRLAGVAWAGHAVLFRRGLLAAAKFSEIRP